MHPAIAALKASSGLCSKCNERPACTHQRWCRGCFNTYMRDYRARQREKYRGLVAAAEAQAQAQGESP